MSEEAQTIELRAENGEIVHINFVPAAGVKEIHEVKEVKEIHEISETKPIDIYDGIYSDTAKPDTSRAHAVEREYITEIRYAYLKNKILECSEMFPSTQNYFLPTWLNPVDPDETYVLWGDTDIYKVPTATLLPYMSSIIQMLYESMTAISNDITDARVRIDTAPDLQSIGDTLTDAALEADYVDTSIVDDIYDMLQTYGTYLEVQEDDEDYEDDWDVWDSGVEDTTETGLFDISEYKLNTKDYTLTKVTDAYTPCYYDANPEIIESYYRKYSADDVWTKPLTEIKTMEEFEAQNYTIPTQLHLDHGSADSIKINDFILYLEERLFEAAKYKFLPPLNKAHSMTEGKLRIILYRFVMDAFGDNIQLDNESIHIATNGEVSSLTSVKMQRLAQTLYLFWIEGSEPNQGVQRLVHYNICKKAITDLVFDSAKIVAAASVPYKEKSNYNHI